MKDHQVEMNMGTEKVGPTPEQCSAIINIEIAACRELQGLEIAAQYESSLREGCSECGKCPQSGIGKGYRFYSEYETRSSVTNNSLQADA
jgi:hypothetical protein